MAHYNVAVLGCGAIFSRHLAALAANPADFNFIGYYDPNPSIVVKWQKELIKQYYYTSEDELYRDSRTNCVVILSPSYLHYSQAKTALLNGKHVIIEKPASFKLAQLEELTSIAKAQQLNVFCILQVRLNPSIKIIQQLLAEDLFGEIRSCSLVQRWQRPLDYFTGWRGSYASCGGVLNEFGVHYLDILQYLLGMPKVLAAKFYHTKFKHAEVADTAYALFDFGAFGGSMEICLAAEPQNIEISLTLLGANGYVKLGGKSLDQIVAIKFAKEEQQQRYLQICQELLGYTIDSQVAIGACPHHPELYKQIINNPSLFQLPITYNAISLVEQINSLDQ